MIFKKQSNQTSLEQRTAISMRFEGGDSSGIQDVWSKGLVHGILLRCLNDLIKKTSGLQLWETTESKGVLDFYREFMGIFLSEADNPGHAPSITSPKIWWIRSCRPWNPIWAAAGLYQFQSNVIRTKVSWRKIQIALTIRCPTVSTNDPKVPD